jgi:phosphohistidine swiveling domain-containing protein
MASSRQAALSFGEGSSSRTSNFHLGGKGYGLAQMVALGLPVPPGFTIPSGVSRAVNQEKSLPRRLTWHIDRELRALELRSGRGFGSADQPLLVSVRSGAAVSMPGMMDTVLNVGINSTVIEGLARIGGARFALDCYRRFLALFGEVVLGVKRTMFTDIVEYFTFEAGVTADHELNVGALTSICREMRRLILDQTGSPVPEDPTEQLNMAIAAVLRSWWSQRAIAYRKSQQIPDSLGTAVSVQAMVFGNLDNRSATGVVFSSNPTTGQPGLNGDFLVGGQGEDVVSGTCNASPIAELQLWDPGVFAELSAGVSLLEQHHNDIVDVEFTVEQGRLYILQTRVAKRTDLAAVVHAVHQVWAGHTTRDEAVYLNASRARKLVQRPEFVRDEMAQAAIDGRPMITGGIPVSPGCAVGRLVMSSAEAVRLSAEGVDVVLYREDTLPEDLPGMLAAKAIFTSNGGPSCHAAVVARDLGLPAVVGCVPLRRFTPGELVSVSGTTGEVYSGSIAVTAISVLPREAKIFLRWCNPPYTPKVDFELVRRKFQVNTLMNDFFLADAMARAAVNSSLESDARDLRRETAVREAEVFLVYLIIAVGAEARHCDSSFRPRDSAQRESWAAVKTLRSKYGVLQDRDDRSDAQSSVQKALEGKDIQAVQELFRLAVLAFSCEETQRSNSYGGLKWAAIAAEALAFVSGQHSPVVFVDAVADLRHNGGRLFDKHRMVSGTDESGVLDQLNTKKREADISRLRTLLARYGNGFSDDVNRLWREGRSLGIWGNSGIFEEPLQKSGGYEALAHGKWCESCKNYECPNPV